MHVQIQLRCADVCVLLNPHTVIDNEVICPSTCSQVLTAYVDIIAHHPASVHSVP